MQPTNPQTTDLFFDKEARDKLLAGAEKLYNAVKTTLGPKGRNVVIGRRGLGPTVTHDGVTVAKSISLKDEAENIGEELIKEAANKLNDVAGDGTTTVTVLTYHLLAQAAKKIEEGMNPMVLAREVEEALDEVLAYLEKLKKPADDLETLTKIATISGGNDEEIGKVVAETVHQVGPAGTVTVDQVMQRETTTEMATGLQLERGWLSPYMVTDDSRGEAVLANKPAILIMHRKVYSFREILPIFGHIDQAGIKECVVIAEDIEGDALPSMVLNSTQGTFRSIAIKAPSFGAQQRKILDDLAAVTGATVISEDTVSLENATMEHVGRAEKVIATRDKTTFIGVEGDLAGRVDWLAEQIKNAPSEYDKEQLEKRKANLEGKVAMIRVGGQTETEIEEKKFRVDDAVAATKAAMSDGYLPGGGVPLYLSPITGKTEGAKLLKTVLQEPFKQLVANSGLDIDEAEGAINQPSQKITSPLKGIDVKTGKTIELVKVGIVDPYRVTRQALETAVSLGVVGMTAGALVVGAE